MAKREKMEAWEEQLIREGNAIQTMHKHHGRPVAFARRLAGVKSPFRKSQVATVNKRDKAAMHVGFAPDRIHG